MKPVGEMTSDEMLALSAADMALAAWAVLASSEPTASGMEARQGGDVKQAPSRSDDSPPGRPETPSSQDTDQ